MQADHGHQPGGVARQDWDSTCGGLDELSGLPHGRTGPLESLDKEDEPGDVGELGEQGHDAVHLVGREGAAEHGACPGTRVHLGGGSLGHGPRSPPEGVFIPARPRPGRAAREPVGP